MIYQQALRAQLRSQDRLLGPLQVLAVQSCMGGPFFINFQQQLSASVLEQKQICTHRVMQICTGPT